MEEYRSCNKCGEVRLVSDFHWKSRRLNKRKSMCKFCWNEYQRQHYQQNKEIYKVKSRLWDNSAKDSFTRFILDYFKTHPCVDCGIKNPLVLTFDHVRGEKEFEICGAGGRYGQDSINKEIDKCDVRCANCHLIKTGARGKWRRFKLSRAYESEVLDGKALLS